LQPASISAVIIVNDQEHKDEEGRVIKKRAAVFVEEAQRPMAIGKKGQNIRLATQLTGFELDMYNYEELPAFKAKLAELRGEDVPVAILNAPATEGAAEAPADMAVPMDAPAPAAEEPKKEKAKKEKKADDKPEEAAA
ncbi:MAG TPA: KH domain-containing protein, partial [Candidatus Peribacteria bacterium]|nr:KH domain-containing protein [Candidatus Peribacteria bacterium]